MIVSYHGGGLCNRLKSLLSAMRMGDDYRVIWPINNYMPCSFTTLFTNNIEFTDKFSSIKQVKVKFGKNFYSSWRLVVLPEDKIDHPVDFMYNDTPKIIKTKYLEKISLLKPVKYVADAVESFSKRFDDKTVSIFVRSWADKHGSSKKRARTFDINLFIEAMNKMNDVSYFFLTCDSEKIVKRLESVFPGKIITFKHRTNRSDIGTAKGMQDIIVDLLLGSKNERLIASSYSTFSEVQWWLSGCKAEVTVVPSWRP